MQTVKRKIDKLGRIVLPVDYRKALGLKILDEVVLSIDGGVVTIKNGEKSCKICGGTGEVLAPFKICPACISKIKNATL